MKILNFSQFILNEKNLSLGELDNHGVNQDRWNILLSILKSPNPELPISSTENIKIKNTKQIVKSITTNGKFDRDKAEDFFKPGKYDDVIEDYDGNFYSLNQIFKNKIFGSCHGSSLGTENTRLLESIQILYLKLRFLINDNLPIDDDLDYTRDLLKKMFSQYSNLFTNVKIQIKLTINDLINVNDSWLVSLINTANAIASAEINFDYITFSKINDYVIYQGYFKGGDLLILSDTFKRLKKLNPNMDQKFDFKKWHPADLWMIDKKFSLKLEKYCNQCQKINDFVDLLNTHLESGDLIGISLKKIDPKRGARVRINKIKDISETGEEIKAPTYDYEFPTLSRDPFAAEGLSIKYYNNRDAKEQDMDFRIFTGRYNISDISGEIDTIGSIARSGKVKLGYINYIINRYFRILSQYGITPIETWDQLLQITEKKVSDLNDKVIQLLILNHGNNFIFKGSERKDKIITPAVLISKYQSLRLVEIMETLVSLGQQKSANKLITHIVNYAASIENVFIKSPKFLLIS